MELRQYLEILRKNFLIITLFALVGAVAAILMVKTTSGLRQDQLFYVAGPESSYFTQENARNFTDSAVAILQSPDFTQEVVATGQTLIIRKVAPQVIRLSAITDNEQAARDLIAKAVNTFNQKQVALTGAFFQLKPIGNPPTTLPTWPQKPAVILFGLVVGLTFGLFIVGLKTYFRL